MNEDQLNRIEQRLTRIENLLETLQTGQPRPYVAPPPVVRVAPLSPPKPPTPVFQFSETNEARKVPTPPIPKADAEYNIGAKVLPRVGAVVFVLGLLYLVSIFISRGFITPPMQFGGELALCIAFVAVGLLKINEREDFGQLLVGIGTCGTFFSFAAAEAFKHIISGETVVAAFVLLGMAVLGFSFWRTSKFFLFLGLIGGLAGALMPLQRHDQRLSMVLDILIALPAALIVLRKRWVDLIPVLFLISTACLAACAQYETQPAISVIALYVSAIVHIAVYALSFEGSEWDRQAIAGGAMVIGAGLHAFAYLQGFNGAVHIGVFAVLCAVLARLLAKNANAKAAIGTAALLLAVGLAPAGWHLLQRVPAYDVAAIILLAFGWGLKLPKLGLISWLPIGLSMLLYATGFAVQTPPGPEMVQLVAIIVATSLATWCSVRWELVKGEEIAPGLFGAFTVVGAFVMRLIFLELSRAGFTGDGAELVAIAALAYAGVVAFFSTVTQLGSAMVSAWTFLTIAVASYLLWMFGTAPNTSHELGLMPFILVVLLLCLASTARWRGTVTNILFPGAIMVWPFWSRLVILILTGREMQWAAAMTISWTIYATLLLAIGMAWKQRELRWGGLVVFGTTLSKVALFDLVALDPGIRVAVLMGLGGAMLVGGYWYIRIKRTHESATETQ